MTNIDEDTVNYRRKKFNKEKYDTVKLLPVVKFVRRRRLQIVRSHEERLDQLDLQWNGNHKEENLGRPMKRWIDTVNEDLEVRTLETKERQSVVIAAKMCRECITSRNRVDKSLCVYQNYWLNTINKIDSYKNNTKKSKVLGRSVVGMEIEI
ncbi:Hypothetical protein CINCED_3A016349 [Cinara cedri]|uniref:Uncharacterized protein n=1 Tax=Cinara cedri TaxID=506608 RepID=A0A5E4MG91_9HEMI|nr:Hypothetical protein CINCED_3A016349 [Cinara cedri]